MTYALDERRPPVALPEPFQTMAAEALEREADALRTRIDESEARWIRCGQIGRAA